MAHATVMPRTLSPRPDTCETGDRVAAGTKHRPIIKCDEYPSFQLQLSASVIHHRYAPPSHPRIHLHNVDDKH